MHASPDTRAKAAGLGTGIRIALGVVSLALAYASLSATLATVISKSLPEKAVQIWPFDGRINNALVLGSAVTANSGPLTQNSSYAVAALMADPTTARAASAIGLRHEVQGDRAGALKAFQYGAKLSSRELQTHLWAINYASERGDIDTVLTHYDRALRTARDAPSLLFPVLANALRDPVVRERLARMAGPAPWRRDFVVYAAQKAPQAESTIAFFAEAPRRGMAIETDVKDTLVATTFGKGMRALAWRYFRSNHPDARPNRSFDPQFSRAGSASTPFDWQIPEEALADTRFDRVSDGTRLAFDTTQSFRGPILRQITALTPGRFRIEARHNLSAEAAPGLEWVLTCYPNGTPLGRAAVSSTTAVFAVPSTCPFQTLSLQTALLANTQGISGTFDKIEILPLAGS
ncbi:MAG: hypothetical protein JNJ92_03120 [Altererythrobacter sp.]|nr:hypothetical protein [Altererythrobacter sp.]